MHKLAIVTGGNSGLGKQTAMMLAQANYDLVLACRDTAKADAVAKEIVDRHSQTRVDVRKLDLSDLESVKIFAESQEQPWNLLINNAGAKIEKPMKLTRQGFEWHLGVNHLGHFALTADLWHMAATDATITTVTSVVATRGSLSFQLDASSFDERKQYANSKLMNYAFAKSLAGRLENTARNSTIAHPGFARAAAYGNVGIRIAEYIFAQSAKAGAKSIFEACNSKNATFSAPQWFELWGKPAPARHPEISAEDLNLFWQKSETLTGRKLLS